MVSKRNNFLAVREAQVIGKLIVGCFLLVRLDLYGEKHIGAAAEKILLALGVRMCESEDKHCTQTLLARRLRMPTSNVRRGLSSLVASGVLKKIGRVYVTTPEFYARSGDYQRQMASLVRSAAGDLQKLAMEL